MKGINTVFITKIQGAGQISHEMLRGKLGEQYREACYRTTSQCLFCKFKISSHNNEMWYSVQTWPLVGPNPNQLAPS